VSVAACFTLYQAFADGQTATHQITSFIPEGLKEMQRKATLVRKIVYQIGDAKSLPNIFLDEAGTSTSRRAVQNISLWPPSHERTFGDYSEFVSLKYGLVEQGMDIEYFHASEDRQGRQRSSVHIIQRNLTGMR